MITDVCSSCHLVVQRNSWRFLATLPGAGCKCREGGREGGQPTKRPPSLRMDAAQGCCCFLAAIPCEEQHTTPTSISGAALCLLGWLWRSKGIAAAAISRGEFASIWPMVEMFSFLGGKFRGEIRVPEICRVFILDLLRSLDDTRIMRCLSCLFVFGIFGCF